MSALAETLLTASCISGLAACCLVLLPRTPPRVRFAVAMTGLAAWVVPWGALRIALPAATPATGPLVAWLDAASVASPAESPLAPSAAAVHLFAGALLVGAALFARDCAALRSSLRKWRDASRPANELRALLPRELAAVAADIRVVERSDVAAASGMLRPTIWIGDRHAGEHRTLALVHEMWHVRAQDPAWLFAVGAVRRAFWWNPLVAYLARQAVLMIESTCDHRCAAELGKTGYIAQLASLLLQSSRPAPRLVATVGAANLDVQRLRLLGEPLRLRARDVVLIAALAAAGTAAAAAAVFDRLTPPSPIAPTFGEAGRSDARLPATEAGAALDALLRAANGGESELLAELLGAYTPQEVALPLPRSARLRIVEVLRSEPTRIEYVVEGTDGRRHVGELAVGIGPTARITATRLQPLN